MTNYKFEINIKIISEWILFLMAIRPILNQFTRSVSFLTIAGYEVKIMTFWSLVYLFLVGIRVLYKPKNKKEIIVLVFIYFVIITLLGLPRIHVKVAFIASYLYQIQFFLSLLVANKLIYDLSFNRIANKISDYSILLFVMHMSSFFWSDSTVFGRLGNFLGAFYNKHIAAASFLSLFPFLLYSYLDTKKRKYLFLLVADLFFLFFTFQRTSILSVILFFAVLLFITKRIKQFIPVILISLVVVFFIPEESIESFKFEKIQREFDEAQSGDIGALGAGRVKTTLIAIDEFLNDFDLIEKLIGKGTAYGYLIHYSWGSLAYAHVQIVETLVDYGVISVIILILLFFKIVRRKVFLYKISKKTENIISIGVLFYFLSQFFYAMPLEAGGTVVLLTFWLFTLKPKYEIQRIV